MCRQTTCSTCGKAGWSGCGAHVEQVLGDVDEEDRCSCTAAANDGPRWLRRMLGG